MNRVDQRIKVWMTEYLPSCVCVKHRDINAFLLIFWWFMSQAYCKLRPVVQWPFSLLECNCCDRISTGQVENLAWAWYSPVHFSTCAKYSQPKNGPEHQAKSVLLSTVTKEGRVVAAVKRFFKQPKIKIKSKQISGWNVGSVQGDQGSISAPQCSSGGIDVQGSASEIPRWEQGSIQGLLVQSDAGKSLWITLHMCSYLGSPSCRRCTVGLNSRPKLLCREWTSGLVL